MLLWTLAHAHVTQQAKLENRSSESEEGSEQWGRILAADFGKEKSAMAGWSYERWLAKRHRSVGL